MTDELDTEADDTDDEQEWVDPKAVRQLREENKRLKKRAKQADEYEVRVTDYERREAVRQAGYELSDKQMKALLAAHEGDTLSPESVKATAIELGWGKEDEPDEEAQAIERMRQASGGGQANISRDWDAEYASATSPEDVLRIARERGTPISSDID